MQISINKEFILFKSKSGNPSLKYKSKLMHSEYNPKLEGERLASSIPVKNTKCLIILGIGLGYHIIPFIKSNIKCILAIDFHRNTFEVLSKAKLITNLKTVKIFNNQNSNFESWLYKNLPENFSNSTKILEHPSSIKIASKYYQKIKESIYKIKKYKLQNYITTLIFSKRWHENSLKNIPHIKNSYKPNKKNKTTCPILIIGSGASIEKSISKVKTVKNKVIIIALAPILNKLLKLKIKPDYVISVDGGIANRIHFKNSYKLKNTVIVSPLSVNPHILRCWKGMKMIINYNDLPLDIFLSSNTISFPMQANVALSAFKLACEITNGEIFFLGLDFGFQKDKYHFQGNGLETILHNITNRFSPFESKNYKIIKSFQNIKVKSYNNKKLNSNISLELYRISMETLVNQSNRKVYTLNQIAAKINGVKPYEFSKLNNYKTNKPEIKSLLTKLNHLDYKHTENQIKIILKLYKKLLKSIANSNNILSCLKNINKIEFQNIILFSESRLLQNNPEGFLLKEKENLLKRIGKYIKIIKKIIN